MNSSPFLCQLIDGQTVTGKLHGIDAESKSVHYHDDHSNQISQLDFHSISHLYHHQPCPGEMTVSFHLRFSDGSTLSSSAEHYKSDSSGDHLYDVGESHNGVHLFLPTGSLHQLSVDSSKEHQTEKNIQGKKIIALVREMIVEAIEKRASDIHLKPLQTVVEVRYRVDGSMQLAHRINRNHYSAIVSRIKILGNMDIAEHRLPQDGAYHLSVNNRGVDLRISTVPTLEGESVVIRILDPKTGLRKISDIGFRFGDEQLFRRMLQQKNGLILITGPTGSGKSTTMYAAMDTLRERALNIISIEDPVEYRMDRVRQIEVNEVANNTFAKNLRHILRHDPDVILIGEIRDQETAKIALQSAYTGHLVLSTLHTRDAPSAITRLLEMGMEPYMLKDTLIGVLSQRLVRKLCDQCHGESPDRAHCHHCNRSGFYGRTPIYELIKVHSLIREQIRDGITADEIRATALENGMVSMELHATELIDQKITTAQESNYHEPS